jgi:hypothetical protein
MSPLQVGVDTTVIALWLGHENVRSTDAYVHADMSTKEKALALTTPSPHDQGATDPTTRPSHSSMLCKHPGAMPTARPTHQAPDRPVRTSPRRSPGLGIGPLRPTVVGSQFGWHVGRLPCRPPVVCDTGPVPSMRRVL